jgi:hypothetical protein
LLSNAARVLSFGLFLPFMLYGLFLAMRCLWERWGTRDTATPPAVPGAAQDFCPESVLLLLLLIVSYSAVHILSWANVRYRLPVDAVLILFAAFAVDSLLSRLHLFCSTRSHPLAPNSRRSTVP